MMNNVLFTAMKDSKGIEMGSTTKAALLDKWFATSLHEIYLTFDPSNLFVHLTFTFSI